MATVQIKGTALGPGERQPMLVHDTCVHRGGTTCRYESWWG